MSKQLIIALATEGTTDIRFLKSIIQRTFEKLAFECQDPVEIFEPICLDLEALEVLPSYQKFQNAVRNVLIQLKYLLK